jgi:hypothetical protein
LDGWIAQAGDFARITKNAHAAGFQVSFDLLGSLGLGLA